MSPAPRPIRVFINAAAARRGGAQTHLDYLLAFLPKQLGLQVYLAGPDSLELPSRPDVQRVRVSWPIENPLARYLWETVGLPRLLRQLQADVLFLPSGTSPGPPGPWKRVSMFRNMVPFAPEQCAKYGWSYMRLRNHLLRRFIAANLGDADLVIFVSQHGREVMSRAVAVRQAVVIPHGVSPAFRETAVERPGWLPQGDYLLYVSTLDFFKAQLEVLRGYALAREAGVRDKLVFAGPEYAPYGRKVRAQIEALGLKEHVLLAGTVPHWELPAAYAHARVNLFASECENCPNILLEAMAAGRPLLCSNRPPMPEFAGNSVVYFDPSDPAQFARELVALVTDPIRMEEYGERARTRSRSYDWQATAARTWEVIAALGAGSPATQAIAGQVVRDRTEPAGPGVEPGSQPIRVLNALYEERVGGPQVRVLQVARRLPASGFETRVVMPEGDPRFAALLRDAGIPYDQLDLVRLRDTLLPAAHLRFATRFWPNVRALRTLIRQHGIQVVHTNGLMHLQAALAARLEGVPVVWHLNDVHTPRLASYVFRALVRRWADGVAVAATAVSQHYFPNGTEPDHWIHLLYAPVDTEKFIPGVDGGRVRAELGIPTDAPVVGVVANVYPLKGVDYLLEAAPAIKQRYPDARFVIVGEMLENRRRYCQALLRRRDQLGLREDFIFAGRRSDMPEVYRAITIFVQCSKAEACPTAVLEASASGLPVVATDVGGTRELVENGVTGMLVEPQNPGRIAEAVLRLLDSPELARGMGRAGAERMRRLFSLDACVEAHIRLYESVVQRKAACSGDRHPASVAR